MLCGTFLASARLAAQCRPVLEVTGGGAVAADTGDAGYLIEATPGGHRVILQNPHLRTVYETHFDNHAAFAIRDFVLRDSGENQVGSGGAGHYLGTDVGRGPLISAEVVRDGIARKTVRLVWARWNISEQRVIPDQRIVEEVTLRPHADHLDIRYVDVKWGAQFVDLATPGGTSSGVHYAHGGDEWIRDYITHNEDTGLYYNRKASQGPVDPEDGGSLNYNGQFILGVYNPDNLRGIGRVYPVEDIEIIKLLVAPETRRGLEVFPHPFFNTHRPFTGHLFGVTGGAADIEATGQALADDELGDPVLPCGTTVELRALPYTGWSFAGWGGEAGGVDPALVFELTGDPVVTADFVMDAALLAEDFEAFAPGDDPPGWVDTDAHNALTVNDSLFAVDTVGDTAALATDSTATNIHSHWTGAGSSAWSDYELSGRFRFEDPDGGVGVTVLSAFPDEASYYRLRRFGAGSFVLTGQGSADLTAGTTDTGVRAEPGRWYRFRVQAHAADERTVIRAMVWEDGNLEPEEWQAVAWDDGAGRRTTGTAGVWSYTAGTKAWDELAVRPVPPDGEPPVVEGLHTEVDGGTTFVEWTTDAPTTGRVEWGEVPAFTEIVEVPGFATSHRVELPGAVPGAHHLLRVTSTSLLGDETTTDDLVFRASAPPPVQDFEDLPLGSDPADWIDTGSDFSLEPVSGAFLVQEEGEDRVLGTTYDGTFVHSHWRGPGSDELRSIELRGRMHIASDGHGMGATVMSGYPDVDGYYGLVRFPRDSFILFARESDWSGGTLDTGVEAVPGVWYHFRLQAVDEGDRTVVRAKVWSDGHLEPEDWLAEGWDAHPTRRTGGTFGVWTRGRSLRSWDDLRTTLLPVPDRPVTVATSTEGSGTVEVDPDLGTWRYGQRVTLTAQPAEGWKFIGWAGDLEGRENPASLDLAGDRAVTARFSEANIDVAAGCADGTIAYWTMDDPAGGTVTDSLLAHAFESSAPWPEVVDGLLGRARRFDGTTGLETPAGPGLDLAGDAGLSLETWVRTGDAGTAPWLERVDPSTGLEVHLGQDAGRPVLRLADDAGSPAVELVAASFIADGGWHWVAGVHDAAAGEARLYVDGALAASAAADFAGDFASSGAPLVAGLPADGGTGLVGTLDDAALHARAIGDAEAAARVADGTAGTPLCPLVCPEVIAEPGDAIVCEGDTARLEVLVRGTPPYAYQWSKDGENLLGATGQVLSLAEVAAADAGDYVLRIENACGPVTSSAVRLDVDPGPSIVTPPLDREVCEGEPVELTVDAEGRDLAYQWFRDGAPLDGATGPVFALEAASATDAGVYTVEVTGPCGSVLSAGALLSVDLAPRLTLQPADVRACEGATVQLQAAAEGAEPLSWSWSKDGKVLGDASGPVLEIAGLAATDAGLYEAEVSNACGATTSTAATLTVDLPPRIDAPPSDTVVAEGEPVTLAVEASGAAPLAWQWRKDGEPVPGADGPALSIAAAAPADAGTYDVVVSNACGETTSPAATLTVRTAPRIVTSPGDVEVCEGDAIALAAEAEGSAPLEWSWSQDGEVIAGADGPVLSIDAATPGDAGVYEATVANDLGQATSAPASVAVLEATRLATAPEATTICPGETLTLSAEAAGAGPIAWSWRKDGEAIPGADTPVYSVEAASAGDAGSYEAVASGPCGEASSDAVEVSLRSPPTITEAPEDVTVCTGEPFTLSAGAQGTEPIAWSWRKDGEAIPGAGAPVYSVEAASTGDAGSYEVVASGPCGETVAAAAVTVRTLPEITTAPSAVEACPGDRVVLRVEAEGPGTLAWSWRRDGEVVPGAEGPELAIDPLREEDLGAYTAVVGNACGTVESPPAEVARGDCGKRFIRSDANGDLVADISDAIFVLAFLFQGADAPGCRAAADANADGAVDVTDPIVVLDLLFRGGSEPPAPWPDCGRAPEGGLDCETTACP